MSSGISAITSFQSIKDIAEAASSSKVEESQGGGFASFLEKSIGEVNTLMKSADKQASEMAVGKAENLHETMIGFEKAETALKLLVQVRNKALDAYHEIMRMQV